MLLGKNYWHVGYRLFLSPPDGSGGGTALDVPADDADIDENADLDDAGKKAIKAERAARREAARKAKEADDALKEAQRQLDAANREKAQRDADAASQAEKDREAKGEFEQLAKDRERERDQAKADLTALQTQFETLKTAATATVKADFDALPEVVREVYPGAADDPVAMLEFLPKGKKLAAALPGGEENNSRNVEGGEPNPKPGGESADPKANEQAQRVNQSRYF